MQRKTPIACQPIEANETGKSLLHRMSDTRALVAQCLSNNARAQKQLYDAYAPTMLGVCYRYATSPDEAHDMLQEGFVRVFRRLEQWRGDGELGAWIRRIMVHTALNWLRDHHKMKLTDITDLPDHALPGVEAEVLPRLQAAELVALLQRLPDGYRAVFNLFAVEGYSHGEVAEALGISEGTSRSQYLRARRMLATWITGNQPEKENDYARTDR